MGWTLSAFADEAADSCAGQIYAVREAGLKHIDIRTMDGHNIGAMPVEHAKKVREQFDRAGITCAMFGSPVGKTDVADDLATDLARLRHMGSLAPILNCKAVRIFSFYNQKLRLPKGGFQREALQRLKQLVAVSRDWGLVLYHENESDIFGDKVEDVLTIAQEIRANSGAQFKMIFDFGNFTAGGENAWENWLKLRDLTDGIHMKDNRRSFDKKLHHVPVGEGDGFVREIVADAVARGFSGPVTVEPHLRHSQAVKGDTNQAFASMAAEESFQIACKAARTLLHSAGAAVD